MERLDPKGELFFIYSHENSNIQTSDIFPPDRKYTFQLIHLG